MSLHPISTNSINKTNPKKLLNSFQKFDFLKIVWLPLSVHQLGVTDMTCLFTVFQINSVKLRTMSRLQFVYLKIY